jgi:hypothetical protein
MQGATHTSQGQQHCTGSMKVAMAEITRNHFLGVFFTLLTTFSTGSLVRADSVAQNQDCASNCEQSAQHQSHAQFGVSTQIKTTPASPASFLAAEQVAVVQPLESAAGGDVHAAVPPPRVTSSSADASEGGSTPGPRFFLIIGSILIGARLIISYRSRKLRKLAAETH